MNSWIARFRFRGRRAFGDLTLSEFATARSANEAATEVINALRKIYPDATIGVEVEESKAEQ